MIADDNGIDMSSGRTGNFKAYTYDALHPEAVGHDRGSINVFGEGVDAASLKTFMRYKLEGRQHQQSREPDQKV